MYRLICWARCTAGELPRDRFAMVVAVPLWLLRLIVVVVSRNLPTKRNRELSEVARPFVVKWAYERADEKLTGGG